MYRACIMSLASSMNIYVRECSLIHEALLESSQANSK